MIKTITLSDFRDAFRNSSYSNNFTYEGLEVLFNYLEELESNIGTPIELDVVSICCDYAGGSAQEIADDRGIELPEGLDDDELLEFVENELEEEMIFVGKTSSTLLYCCN